jgi:hypothetical protein
MDMAGDYGYCPCPAGGPMPLKEAIEIARQVEAQAMRGSGNERSKKISVALEMVIALAESNIEKVELN